MSLTVDRSILLQASWPNTLRLARWIGATRLPTCDCPSCRAVVVGALDRYLRGRSWTCADGHRAALRRRLTRASQLVARRAAHLPATQFFRVFVDTESALPDCLRMCFL
jgi:hypothetical protein